MYLRYDSLDRLIGEARYDAQQQLLWSKGYTYDLSGNRLEMNDNGTPVSYQLGQMNSNNCVNRSSKSKSANSKCLIVK